MNYLKSWWKYQTSFCALAKDRFVVFSLFQSFSVSILIWDEAIFWCHSTFRPNVRCEVKMNEFCTQRNNRFDIFLADFFLFVALWKTQSRKKVFFVDFFCNLFIFRSHTFIGSSTWTDREWLNVKRVSINLLISEHGQRQNNDLNSLSRLGNKKYIILLSVLSLSSLFSMRITRE